MLGLLQVLNLAFRADILSSLLPPTQLLSWSLSWSGVSPSPYLICKFLEYSVLVQ